MSTVFGFRVARNFDRIINTRVIPAISEAYGELISDMAGISNDTKDALLLEVTNHLIDLLTSECEDNAFKKLSDKQVKEYSKHLILGVKVWRIYSLILTT